MKKQLIFFLGLMPMLAMAQTGQFSLTGKIGNFNAPAKVYFDHMDEGVSKMDSAVLVNGAFKFAGTNANYSYVRMALNRDGTGKDRAIYGGGDVIYFYIGNENFTITSGDSLSNATIAGSPVNDGYVAYNKFIGGSIMDLVKNVNAAFNIGTPEQQKDTVFTKAVDVAYRKHMSDRNDKQIEFAKVNPGSYFSIVALSEAGGASSVLSIEPVFNALSDTYKNTDAAKELAQRIEAAHTIVMGAVAPVFTQTDFKGNPVSLKDKLGKYVLVEFWASWCGPCRAENPNLLEQYGKYKDKGFDILSVSLDDDRNKWATAIKKDALPWTHLSDLKGWNNEVGRAYGVRAVPASFLIDPTGKIIGIGLRGDSLNEKLATLFN